MMYKRKLGGTVGKFSVEQQIYKSNAIIHIMGKSRVLYLAEPGLTAGSLANEMQVKFNNLVYRSKYLVF